MPNWCENKLTIDSKNSLDLHVFVEKYLTIKPDGSYTFDFNKVIPEPETLEECPKRYILNDDNHYLQLREGKAWFNWYDWHCAKWGSKWNAHDVDVIVDFDACSLTIFYMTAWSPSIPVVQKLMSKNKSLTFRYYYYEPGMAFAGFMDSDGADEYFNGDDEAYRQFTIDAGFETQEFWDWLDNEDK